MTTDDKPCEPVENDLVMPGWACCSCPTPDGRRTYNGNVRKFCKACGHRRCDLPPDTERSS